MRSRPKPQARRAGPSRPAAGGVSVRRGVSLLLEVEHAQGKGSLWVYVTEASETNSAENHKVLLESLEKIVVIQMFCTRGYVTRRLHGTQ